MIYLLLIALLTGPAWATTYYVDPGATVETGSCATDAGQCNDACDGTVASGTGGNGPWCTPPGTREADNSGFLRTQWGSITTLARVDCDDTIYLKGGTTYSSTDGGAWRIACGTGEYYNCSCASTSRITLRVATSAEWTGSSGDLTFNVSGITPNTNNAGLQRRGVVNIQNTDSLTFGGNSTPQYLVFDGSPASTTDFCPHVLVSGNSGTCDYIEMAYVKSQNYASASSGDAGVLVADTEDSLFRDITIDNNRKLGFWTGPFQAGPVRSVGLVRVVVKNSGPSGATTNEPQDAFQMGCTRWDTSYGGGGGAWIVDGGAYDNYWNGIIGGGSNSCTDEVLRVRGWDAVGNGRNSDASSARVGWENAGKDNSCDTADQQAIWFFKSRFYGNYNSATNGPHGNPNYGVGGVSNVLNSTFYLSGTVNSLITYNRVGCEQEYWNNIFKGNQVPFGWGSNTYPGDYKPVSKNNLIDYWSADSQSLTTFIFSGASFSATTKTFAQAADDPAGVTGWLTASDRISKSANRQDPSFVSTGGSCATTGFSDGNMKTRYDDCDFNLQSDSDAIDNGAFFLLADGAGVSATTVTVKNNGHGTRSPHAADPRIYFIEPDSYWHAGTCSNDSTVACSTDGECGAGTCYGDTIEIEGCGEVRVTNMSATTITFSPACSWSDGAGVHLPWNGTAPDIGAYEYAACHGAR